MQHHTPHLSLAICLTLSLMCLSGCTTVPIKTRTETRQTVTQQARMPALTGPDAVGTMTPVDKASIQGSMHYTHVVPNQTDSSNSQLGHAIQNRTFQGRLSFGLSKRLELGLSGRYSNSSWGENASDAIPTQAAESHSAHVFSGGTQLRILLVDHHILGLAILGEGHLSQVHYRRDVYQTKRTITTFPDGTEERSPAEITSFSESGAELFFAGKAGLQLFAKIIPGVTLNGGFIMQNTRRYWAQRNMGKTCDAFIGDVIPERCDGDTYDDLTRYNPVFSGTTFLGGSLDFAALPISLHAQVYHNTFAPELLLATMPFGFDLAARLTF